MMFFKMPDFNKLKDKQVFVVRMRDDETGKWIYLMPSRDGSSRFGYDFCRKPRYARRCSYNRAVKLAKSWVGPYKPQICGLWFFNLFARPLVEFYADKK